MHDLFSHAPDPEPPLSGTHPRSPQTWVITVPVGIVQATEGFLDYLHLWWPTSLYSVHGSGGQLWWDSESLVEESEMGDTVVWGKSEVWDPPLTVTAELALSGAAGDRWAMTVEPRGMNSEVTWRAPLPRSSPSRSGEAAIPEDFWGQVLGYYARFMGASETVEQR